MTEKKRNITHHYTQRQTALKAEAAKKRRKRIIITVVGLIVIALVPVGVVLSQLNDTTSSKPNTHDFPSGTPQTPPTITKVGDILIPPYGSEQMAWITTTHAPKPDALIVNEHVEYQCDRCQLVHSLYSDLFQELADRGDIVLQIHLRSFLDKGTYESNGDVLDETARGMSLSTVAASVCADTVGMFSAYHDAAFTHAYKQTLDASLEQLIIQIPNEIGMTGGELENFQECVTTEMMLPYVYAMEKTNLTSRTINGKDHDTVRGTPAFFIDGNFMMMSEIVGLTEDQTDYMALFTTADELLTYLISVSKLP
ncbi:MAG: thioredoxin domain-containing protein [Propionibacteriaceae bacterium]|jgi:protein-disulfide isomerase|nr:thioredoxin domain-containing protein [Propionibacteriaceae bacterium]